jgi:endonuclease YncB( thermonuclease family)
MCDSPLTRSIALAAGALIWSVAFAAAQAALPEPPKQMQARVTTVHDGDSITVVDTKQKYYRVSLDGIDAPELAQTYGESSKKHLERRILNKSVLLMWHKTASDGTLIARVLLSNGDINLLQVRSGSAWTTNNLTVNYNGNDKARYTAAQQHAKEKGLGLWRLDDTTAPWEWRKQQLSQQQPKGD